MGGAISSEEEKAPPIPFPKEVDIYIPNDVKNNTYHSVVLDQFQGPFSKEKGPYNILYASSGRQPLHTSIQPAKFCAAASSSSGVSLTALAALPAAG